MIFFIIAFTIGIAYTTINEKAPAKKTTAEKSPREAQDGQRR